MKLFIYFISPIFLLSPTKSIADSSFREVRDVLLNRNVPINSQEELAEFEAYRHGMPHYEINLSTLKKDGNNALERRAHQTISDQFDYYPHLNKMLHSNGICFTGEWNISEETKYSGYFRKNSRGLFIGRASTALGNTEWGAKRGFGFAGKIFPTSDANKKVETANFFAVDVLVGTKINNITQTAMTNEPPTGISIFDVGLIPMALFISNSLGKADTNPNFRQVYQISELGLEPSEQPVTPHWIKVSFDPSTPVAYQADFRNELVESFDKGHGLRLLISVSDITNDRTTNDGWLTIGHIDLKERVISYGCDRRLHFQHPKLK